MFKNKKLLLIYAIVLIDVIAGSIMWPVWPQFVKGYTYPSLLLALGTGIFIGIQLISAPLIGKFSDVRGRKSVFILSAAGTFLANLLLLPRNAFAYFSNHAADGLTNGVYTAVRASITDISSEEDLTKNIGLEGTIVSLGFVLGPLVAASILLIFNVSEADSTITLIYTGISISFINIILSFLFRETLSQKSEFQKGELWALVRESFLLKRHVSRLLSINRERPGLLNVILLQLCLTLSLGYYNYLITFISLGQLKMTPQQISYFFIYFGAISIFVSYFFFSYLVSKINPRSFIAFMAFMGMATHIGYALTSDSMLSLYIVVTIDCLTISLIPGILDGLIADFTTEDDRGEVFGIAQALNGMASFLTTLVFGGLSLWALSIPFYWFAVCLVPLLFSRKLLKQ